LAERILIRDLKPSQWVEGVFSLHNCQLGQTKTGKPYIKCLVGDRSMRVPGRMWNASEQLFSCLPTDGFVRLEGQTQPYQGELQIIIQRIETTVPSHADLCELLPSTEHDIDKMFREVMRRLGSIEHPGLRAILDAYLEDGELMEQFCAAPAAITLHHAYLGGLLEHTLQLLRVADAICPLYPGINADLVKMGLFLHDLGKCSELHWSTGFAYSEDGHLVGHVARGVIWLDRKVQQLRADGVVAPESLVRVLHHIILSHHTRPEYGALKQPATPEAVAIALIDNMDAKLQMVTAAADRPGLAEASDSLRGDFTEKIWALETRVYRPDPTAEPMPEPELATDAPGEGESEPQGDASAASGLAASGHAAGTDAADASSESDAGPPEATVRREASS